MNDIVALRVRRQLALAVAMALGGGTVHAASITVADGGDAGSASTCTLRQAIVSANNDASGSSTCTAGVGDDTIEFATSLANATITLDGTPLDVAHNLDIHGSGQTIDAAGGSRVLLIEKKGHLSASRLALTGGAANDGAGVYLKDEAYLTLDKTTVTGNVADDKGGGIYAHSHNTVDITESTISGNQAGAQAGGIYAFSTLLTVSGSTISNNTATTSGGGIFATDFSALEINSSTISGNTSLTLGGGIYASTYSDLEISNSTIAGNDADYGGAVYSHHISLFIVGSTISANTATTAGAGLHAYIGASDETIAMANTVLAGNTAPADADLYSDAVGTAAVSAASSLLGLALQANFSGNDNLFNDAPGLGVLQNNGGATQTMLPLASSPVVDAGDNSSTTPAMTNDQRGVGYARIVNVTVDIGAVELQPNVDMIFRNGFEL